MSNNYEVDDIEEDIDDDDNDFIDIVPVIPEEPVVIFGKEINAVLFEMIAGIIVFGLTAQILIVWFLTDKLGFSLGLLLGIIVAIGYTIHMWWSIGQYLYMGTYAPGLARKHMAIRYMVVALVLGAAAMINQIEFLAVVLGVLGIKVGAFMQPLLRKVIKRGNENG